MFLYSYTNMRKHKAERKTKRKERKRERNTEPIYLGAT